MAARPLSVPSLAADGAAEPRRSLVLAGGGMRVAYQAGVLLALEEAGLRFAHADGTSGGTINLAMLLSGVPPAEMCRRWRTLRVADFGSPLPLKKYLDAADLPAIGDADGIVGKVFPHLGVDVARIREAEGIEGTFNVCNYTEKTNEAVPHRDVDLDLLVAGISLPIFMPPRRRGDALYTDSVWIRDANLPEAVRRGAEEIWLVWCIGNTARYRNGLFNQYVHMIELAANGSLFEDFEQIRARLGDRPLPRLHVIRPEHPLPLDPDFYLGRITGDELVSLGYADARAYLARMRPEGVPWRPDATKMEDAGAAVSFRETLSGTIAAERAELHLRVDVPDLDRFLAGPERSGRLTGRLEWGGRSLLASEGRLTVTEPGLVTYEAAFGDLTFLARKEAHGLWRGLTSARASLRSGGDELGSGDLSTDVRGLVRGVQVPNAASGRERRRARLAVARFLLRGLRGQTRP